MSDDQPIVRYPFRLRDALTGKWYRARWNASLTEIESHRGEWIIDGPPETYAALGSTSNFQLERRPAPGRDRLQMHPQRDYPPSIEQLERFLACVFLRRYTTYCVRRKQYAEAQGAAVLFRELRAQ